MAAGIRELAPRGHYLAAEVGRQPSATRWAARQRDLSHIEVNPDRLSGSPVIAATRSPADDVARLAATDDGEAILWADYGQSD